MLEPSLNSFESSIYYHQISVRLVLTSPKKLFWSLNHVVNWFFHRRNAVALLWYSPRPVPFRLYLPGINLEVMLTHETIIQCTKAWLFNVLLRPDYTLSDNSVFIAWTLKCLRDGWLLTTQTALLLTLDRGLPIKAASKTMEPLVRLTWILRTEWIQQAAFLMFLLVKLPLFISGRNVSDACVETGSRVLITGSSGPYTSWECVVDSGQPTNVPVNGIVENGLLLCEQDGLSDSPHVLTVNVQATNGSIFWLDYVKYLPTASTTGWESAAIWFDATDPQLDFQGWTESLSLIGLLTSTSTTGSKLSFNFIGKKCYMQG